jgi:hypothetical protein
MPRTAFRSSIVPRAIRPVKFGMSETDLRIAALDSWREHIRAVSTVLRRERAGDERRSWAGALPIRHVPVSRLRLRQARVLWVFNPNALETKELVNDASCYTSYATCGTRVRHIGYYHTIDLPISAKRPRLAGRATKARAAPAAQAAYWNSPCIQLTVPSYRDLIDKNGRRHRR